MRTSELAHPLERPVNRARAVRVSGTAAALAACLALLVAGAVISGCAGGTAYRLNSRSRQAGDARASIRLRQDGNVTQVRVATSRLPEPAWVRPGARVWRVWARTGGGDTAWAVVGDLDGGGFLGWTRAPGPAFELWVTPEINPRAIGPTFGPTFVGRLP